VSALHQPDAGADESRASGKGLQTAPVAAPAQWTVRQDSLVPDLTGCSQRAEPELPVDYHPATDPGTHGDDDHGLRPTALAKPKFSEGRHSRVVEQEDRAAHGGR